MGEGFEGLGLLNAALVDLVLAGGDGVPEPADDGVSPSVIQCLE